MEMNVKIDVNDYYSDDEIREIIKNELKERIESYARREYPVLEAVADAIIKDDAGLREIIRLQVIRCIEDLSPFYVFHDDRDGCKSDGRKVLDEEVAKLRPRIAEQMESVIPQLDESYMYAEANEVVIEALKNGLNSYKFGKGDSE